MDAVLTVLACLALIAGFTLAGMSVLKRGGNPKGATGTLGSALGMIDPATGAPTREEAAAAREELKQRRHESTQSGKGPDHNEAYTGKITIRAARRPDAAPGFPAAAPTQTGAAADVKGTDTI
ncbi:hypothetical protein AB0N24_16715 [Arthrobacter sp. NPDC093128]|uniref:hypothetical protein n=1 Tax=Arthrobacter sp. NPDC093128 TaxID=3154979 RepID=UPI0034177D7C